MVIGLSGVQFIMVIEQSGVQFGLKSYAWFQNQTSAQREFDLKSLVWFQTKIVRPEVQLLLYYIHFEIIQFNILTTRTTRQQKLPNLPNNGLLYFIFLQCDWLVLKNLEILLVVLFYCLILIGWEKDAI